MLDGFEIACNITSNNFVLDLRLFAFGLEKFMNLIRSSAVVAVFVVHLSVL